MKFGAIVLIVILVLVFVLLFWLIAGGYSNSDFVSAIIGLLLGAAISGLVQLLTSEARIKHEIRMAALEKRLEAHQQAYSLWRKMLFAEPTKTNEVVSECTAPQTSDTKMG